METHELDRFERLVHMVANLRQERNAMEDAMLRILERNHPEIDSCENPYGRTILEWGNLVAHVGDSGLHRKGK